jgi:hypothetical protein
MFAAASWNLTSDCLLTPILSDYRAFGNDAPVGPRELELYLNLWLRLIQGQVKAILKVQTLNTFMSGNTSNQSLL